MAGITAAEARAIVDAIDAQITGNTELAQSYSINGRSLSRYSVDELLKLRDYYEAKADDATASFVRGRVRLPDGTP